MRYGAIDEEGRPIGGGLLGAHGGRTGRLPMLSWRERWLLILALLSVIFVGGLSVQRAVQYWPERNATSGMYLEGPKSVDFAFALLMIINCGFCFYYVLSGVLGERLFEMYAFMLSTALVLIYSITEYSIDAERRTTMKLIRLIMACLLAPADLVLAVLVVRSFGWLEFRIAGVTASIQAIYRHRSFMMSLLAFDLQAVISFTSLSLTNGTTITTGKLVIFTLILPLSVAWTLFVCVAVRGEYSKKYCIVLAGLGLIVPVYVLVDVILILVTSADRPFLITSTLVAGFLVLAVRLSVFLLLARVVADFGKGMKGQPVVFDAFIERVPRLRDYCCAPFSTSSVTM